MEQDEALIEIYDLQGGLKIKENILQKSAVDVSALKAGMYVLRISASGEAYYVKIILK